ncbi:sensor histidine kinase [Castellaniella sp.]|uniref:sensor histidine kinase n=1 Tax=Castellaniella sp. TaxID=1955812 RepID=UPI002AFECC15|nr:ATP-binding protein [Castellaniella sp.]
MPRQGPLILRSLTCQVLIWGLLLLLAGGALAAWQYQSLISTLENESNALHRSASQRADQHDAHLTALSAVANASADPSHKLFLDVATTVAQFYPRIDDIQLVPLDAREASAGLHPLSPDLAQRIRAAVNASNGQIAVLPYPERPEHYILLKRSPNTPAARYGLMLGIDAHQLIGEASPFWSKPGVNLRLSLPDGQVLVSRAPASAGTLHFSKALASASQPLMLATGMTIGPGDLFPLMPTTLALLLVSAVYIAVLAAWRQRLSTRAAVEQARLSALESRLAHASRVNALGEMASGLAHELTQPLTAILAQTQASRRMFTQGNPALGSVFEDTVAQAKRASAILERFRNWSRPQPANTAVFDLREALGNVQALLAPQAAASQARLTFDLPAQAVLIQADPIEMEQVLFNLVRNALEAVAQQDAGQITVTLRQTGTDVVLDVSDNGPGVAPEIQHRLFTPFTTNRPDGTGLGLALSQRLVERAGGDVFLADKGPGTTFRVTLKAQTPPKEENV